MGRCDFCQQNHSSVDLFTVFGEGNVMLFVHVNIFTF